MHQVKSQLQKLVILVVDGRHCFDLTPKDNTPAASGEYARILFFRGSGGGFKDVAVTTTVIILQDRS
jgi:hypothetical protein